MGLLSWYIPYQCSSESVETNVNQVCLSVVTGATATFNCIHGWIWSSGRMRLFVVPLVNPFHRLACQPGKRRVEKGLKYSNNTNSTQPPCCKNTLLQHLTSQETTRWRAEVPFIPVCRPKSFVSQTSLAESPLLSVTLTPFIQFSHPAPPPCHCDPCQQSNTTFFWLLVSNTRARTHTHTPTPTHTQTHACSGPRRGYCPVLFTKTLEFPASLSAEHSVKFQYV